MINTKLLLALSLVTISIVYYILLPLNKIINIILDEYILFILILIFIFINRYFITKLKDKLLFEFIKNLNYVPILSTSIFFIIFEIVDYYQYDGLLGMISQWFLYWIFGVLAYFLTHTINLYKNYKAYKDKGYF